MPSSEAQQPEPIDDPKLLQQGLPNNFYLVDRIIKSAFAEDGREMFLVSWKGWGQEYNSWVYGETVMPLQKLMGEEGKGRGVGIEKGKGKRRGRPRKNCEETQQIQSVKTKSKNISKGKLAGVSVDEIEAFKLRLKRPKLALGLTSEKDKKSNNQPILRSKLASVSKRQAQPAKIKSKTTKISNLKNYRYANKKDETKMRKKQRFFTQIFEDSPSKIHPILKQKQAVVSIKPQKLLQFEQKRPCQISAISRTQKSPKDSVTCVHDEASQAKDNKKVIQLDFSINMDQEISEFNLSRISMNLNSNITTCRKSKQPSPRKLDSEVVYNQKKGDGKSRNSNDDGTKIQSCDTNGISSKIEAVKEEVKVSQTSQNVLKTADYRFQLIQNTCGTSKIEKTETKYEQLPPNIETYKQTQPEEQPQQKQYGNFNPITMITKPINHIPQTYIQNSISKALTDNEHNPYACMIPTGLKQSEFPDIVEQKSQSIDPSRSRLSQNTSFINQSQSQSQDISLISKSSLRLSHSSECTPTNSLTSSSIAQSQQTKEQPQQPPHNPQLPDDSPSESQSHSNPQTSTTTTYTYPIDAPDPNSIIVPQNRQQSSLFPELYRICGGQDQHQGEDRMQKQMRYSYSFESWEVGEALKQIKNEEGSDTNVDEIEQRAQQDRNVFVRSNGKLNSISGEPRPQESMNGAHQSSSSGNSVAYWQPKDKPRGDGEPPQAKNPSGRAKVWRN